MESIEEILNEVTRFKCIGSIKKKVNCAANKTTTSIEKLFVPIKNQHYSIPSIKKRESQKRKYGTSYRGGKNEIAEWILGHFPQADYFVDVFVGGGSVTHAAIESGKFKYFLINDILQGQSEFIKDCFLGTIDPARFLTWVSKDEFMEKRRTDAFIRSVWSFGSGGLDYAFSKEKEPIKKMFFQLVTSNDLNEKLYVLNELIVNINRGCLIKKDRIRVEPLERMKRILQMKKENLSIRSYQDDFQKISIPKNSVVYCDPPYKGARGYGVKLDYERFYKWCESLDCPVFISEYNMP